MAKEQEVIHIVPSYTLAASGVITAGTPTPVIGVRFATLFCKYTRGGNAGSVQINICYSADGTKFYQESRQVFQDLVPGNDDSIDVQRDFFVYKATGASEEDFIIEVTDHSHPAKLNAHSMRLDTAELGNTGSPGVLDVVLRATKESF